MSTEFNSLALFRHQQRELAAIRRATVGGAPKASSSRYIVEPRRHCLSWMARNRCRSHSSSSRQTRGVCASWK